MSIGLDSKYLGPQVYIRVSTLLSFTDALNRHGDADGLGKQRCFKVQEASRLLRETIAEADHDVLITQDTITGEPRIELYPR